MGQIKLSLRQSARSQNGERVGTAFVATYPSSTELAAAEVALAAGFNGLSSRNWGDPPADAQDVAYVHQVVVQATGEPGSSFKGSKIVLEWTTGFDAWDALSAAVAEIAMSAGLTQEITTIHGSIEVAVVVAKLQSVIAELQATLLSAVAGRR